MCEPLDLACKAGQSALESITQSCVEAASKAIVWAMGWWATTGTINPNSTVVRQLQHYILPVVALVLVCSVLWQAFQMAITRKPEPLVRVAAGTARYAMVYLVGLVGWEVAVQISDIVARGIITKTADDFGKHIAGQLGSLNQLSPICALIISLVLFILSLIQWVLGFVRQAGIEILAVLLPLAAAGSLSVSTQSWLRKINAWMIGLIAYKPTAALIYMIGFKLMTAPAQDAAGQPLTQSNPETQALSAEIIGTMVLALAVFCLPAMLKFFSAFGVDHSGGGVAGVLAAGTMAAGFGAARLAGSAAGGAVESAARMETTGPASGGGGGGGSAPGSAGPAGGQPPGPNGGGGGGGAWPSWLANGGSSSTSNTGASPPPSSSSGTPGSGTSPSPAPAPSSAPSTTGAPGAVNTAGVAGPVGVAAAGAHQVKQAARTAGQEFGGQPPPPTP